MKRVEEMKRRFITDYGKPRRFRDVLSARGSIVRDRQQQKWEHCMQLVFYTFICESASAIHLYTSEKAFPSCASGEVHYIIHTQIA